MDDCKSQSPFLRLPPEIRLIIYELVLLRSPEAIGTTHTTSLARVLPASSGYHEYEALKSGKRRASTGATLKLRTEDPGSYEVRKASHLRSSFLIRSDRFRARTMATTYHLLSNPGLTSNLLLANARIHAEAAHCFYSAYTFDFDTHIEAIVPFFSDLTPQSRASVHSIRIVKRALPYEKDFDRAEWAAAMEYLAENLSLKSLSLGIVAGKPGPNGWDLLPPLSATDFHYMQQTDGMEWMGELLALKGLERLEVDAVVEHCPPPMSMAMARYIRFSSSIDSSFAGYLKERMVGC